MSTNMDVEFNRNRREKDVVGEWRPESPRSSEMGRLMGIRENGQGGRREVGADERFLNELVKRNAAGMIENGRSVEFLDLGSAQELINTVVEGRLAASKEVFVSGQRLEISGGKTPSATFRAKAGYEGKPQGMPAKVKLGLDLKLELVNGDKRLETRYFGGDGLSSLAFEPALPIIQRATDDAFSNGKIPEQVNVQQIVEQVRTQPEESVAEALAKKFEGVGVEGLGVKIRVVDSGPQKGFQVEFTGRGTYQAVLERAWGYMRDNKPVPENLKAQKARLDQAAKVAGLEGLVLNHLGDLRSARKTLEMDSLTERAYGVLDGAVRGRKITAVDAMCLSGYMEEVLRNAKIDEEKRQTSPNETRGAELAAGASVEVNRGAEYWKGKVKDWAVQEYKMGGFKFTGRTGEIDRNNRTPLVDVMLSSSSEMGMNTGYPPEEVRVLEMPAKGQTVGRQKLVGVSQNDELIAVAHNTADGSQGRGGVFLAVFQMDRMEAGKLISEAERDPKVLFELMKAVHGGPIQRDDGAGVSVELGEKVVFLKNTSYGGTRSENKSVAAPSENYQPFSGGREQKKTEVGRRVDPAPVQERILDVWEGKNLNLTGLRPEMMGLLRGLKGDPWVMVDLMEKLTPQEAQVIVGLVSGAQKEGDVPEELLKLQKRLQQR